MREIDAILKMRFWKKNDPLFPLYLERLAFVEDTIEELLLGIFEGGAAADIDEAPPAPGNIEEAKLYGLDRPEADREEIEEIRRFIAKLGRKLAVRLSRRYRKSKRGRVDLQRTTRSAFSTGGIPVLLKNKKRTRKQSEMVLLCDASKSVAPFSAFMLQLVYSLQNQFRAVRSFLFVDVIDEVTEYLRGTDFDRALERALTEGRFSRSGISDFGRVFAMFASKYLPDISPRSTVIVVADARNNGYPDERNYLEQIAGRVRRLIWLNPQPSEEWDKDDNIMSVYAPYCDQVFECRNLKQLEEAVRRVF